MTRSMMAAAALSLLGAGTALAGPQFSADTVQMQPGQEMRSGKLFVGEKGMRYEFQQDGQPVVQVMLPAQGIMRVMFPLSRTYMEMEAPQGASLIEARPDVPCKASAEVECVKEGDDATRAGVQRWTIRAKVGPGPLRVWWDTKRKMAVREEYSDGRVMQSTLRGPEQYEGRMVEGWETVYMSPSGQYRRAMSLYAPELGIAVVEQQPGGAIRELRNVQVGAPDPKLFALPENFKKIDPAEMEKDAAASADGRGTTPPAQPKSEGRMTPQATGPSAQQHGAMPQQPPMGMQAPAAQPMVTPPHIVPEGPGAQPQSQAPQMQGPMSLQDMQRMRQQQMQQMQQMREQQVQEMQEQMQRMRAQQQQQLQQQQQQQPTPPAQSQAPAQPETAPMSGAAPWQPQPPQQANGQQMQPQGPAYPAFGMQPAPYGYPPYQGAPAAAPQNGQAAPQQAPMPMQPVFPGYGMQPGAMGPYGYPVYGAPQPAPAPTPADKPTPSAENAGAAAPAAQTQSAKGKKP